MASCSFTSTGRTFTLNVSESSYSIENNTSNIYWEINISGGGTQWYDTYCKAIVNGSVVFNESKSWSSGVFPAKDGSVSGYIYNVPHDSEGRASVSFYIEGYSEVYDTKSASGSLTLTTIPRATPAPNITCDVENTTSFTLTPYANFSHSVSISFGTINKYLKTDGTLSNSEVKYDTSIRTWNFNADKSYYKQFNKKSGQGSITVRTYSGSTLVGSKSGTLTVVANQALCSPVITGTVIDTNETTKTLTGNENVIIKYKSTPRVTTQIQITSPNDDNSTLSYLQVAGNNISDLTQRVFDVQNPTQNSFIIKAINSRDYSTETPLTASAGFIDYILPTITITSAKRTEPTTGDAIIEYKGDWFNNKFSENVSNTLTLTWKYKEKGQTAYTSGGTLIPTVKDNTFSGTINVDGLFNYLKQYDVIIVVEDKLTSIDSAVVNIPRGFPIFWWSENFVDILGELRINGVNPFGYKPPLKIASVALRGNVELPAETYKTVPYSRIRHLDENLTLNNRGGVEINVDCTFAIVIVRQRTTTAGTVNIGVQTNNNPLYSITNQYSEAYAGGSSTFLLPVTKGDIIYTAMYSPTATEIFGAETNDFWVGMDIILI